MKRLFILWMLFTTISIMTSCSKAPDNIIHKQETLKGDWVYDSVQGKPVQQEIVNYLLSPTLGQSFDIASRRKDHKNKLGLAICFITVFLFLFVGVFLHLNYVPKWYEENAIFQGVVNFLLIGFAVHFTISDAVGIKNNNDKWVDKKLYDSVIKADGSTKTIWNDFERNHQIVDGPY